MTRTADVAIVGAGIVGAACARALARAGQRVIVVDAGPIGGGATAAGMGHVVVMDDSPAQLALTHYSQQLWDALADQLPASAERQACGTIWVAADDEEMAEVHRKQQLFAAAGIAAEVLGPAELTRHEPHLRSGLAGGLRVTGDTVVYPPCATGWLIDDALLHGAVLTRGVHVVAIAAGRVDLADGSHIVAGTVINAAGAAATILSPELPIRKRKGHLVITDRYPGSVTHQLLELGYLKSAHGSDRDSVAFNVQPRSTGQLLVGSSRQYDVDSPEVDRAILSRMIARAIEYMPDLARLSAIRVWTGFRAATPDSLPLVGPHPSQCGVYIAAGHEGLGITTSLGTGELLADQILGRESAIDVAPYLPERFQGAALHG